MVKETYDPPAMSADAVDQVVQDALFRAQRMASLHESIRMMIPELPSVYVPNADGESQYVANPHVSYHSSRLTIPSLHLQESELVLKRLRYWQAANDAIQPLVTSHTQALEHCITQIRQATLQVANDTLQQHEQRG